MEWFAVMFVGLLLGLTLGVIWLGYRLYRIKHAKNYLSLSELNSLIPKFKQKFDDIQSFRHLLSNYQSPDTIALEKEYEQRRHLSFGFSKDSVRKKINSLLDELELYLPTRHIYDATYTLDGADIIRYDQLIITPHKLYIFHVMPIHLKELSVSDFTEWSGVLAKGDAKLVLENPLPEGERAIRHLKRLLRNTAYLDFPIEYILLFPKSVRVKNHSSMRVATGANLGYILNHVEDEPEWELTLNEMNMLWSHFVYESDIGRKKIEYTKLMQGEESVTAGQELTHALDND